MAGQDDSVPRRLPALTGLRFVVASMVFVLHSLPAQERWIGLDQGVSFFFVLSGFILTYVYPDLPDWAAVQRFYLARIARLWPLHLFVTLVVIVVLGHQPNLVVLPLNLMLVQAWVPVQRIYFSYNAVSWSISTELFFYLSFPLLIRNFAGTWHWKLGACCAVVGMLIVGCNLLQVPLSSPDSISAHGLLYINPMARMLEFIAGMGCCLAWRRLPAGIFGGAIGIFSVAEALAIALAATLIIWPFPFTEAFIGPAGTLWLARTSALPAFCLIVVLFAVGRGLISRMLGSRAFEFLGEISFAIYLVHLSTLDLWRIWLQPTLSVSPAGNFAITAAMTLSAAVTLHFAIERPCRMRIVRWSRSLSVGPYTPTAVIGRHQPHEKVFCK